MIRFLVLLLLCDACAPSDDATGAVQWPEADALFHQDPRWLGADAAYSVPLGDGRILWLFGDTFIATTDAHVRRQSKMVRNTIGIQSGADPTTATMRFYWRGTEAEPLSYFPEDGDRWYWPGHGVRVGASLVLFLSRLQPTPGDGLGFASEGWRAAIIDDASGDPSTWNLRLVASTTAPAGINAGAAIVREGETLVSLAVREPGDHAGYLVRWQAPNLLAGNLELAEWWTDDDWNSQVVLAGHLATVLPDAGPESSLHWEPTRNQWMHVRSDGFGATTIVASYASALTGPWSAPTFLYRPPESDRADAFVYAGKAHPEQEAGGALAVTYAANTLADFATLLDDLTLYFPRFVKVPR